MCCSRSSLLYALLGALSSGYACADLYLSDYSEPDYDRWNYMFNGTPGERIVASTFSAYGSGYDFDDRDGQVLLGWVTVDIPTDLPASSYRVLSMTVDIAIASDCTGHVHTPGTWKEGFWHKHSSVFLPCWSIYKDVID